MQLTDSVAVTALVISLVALVIATFQFLQSSFLTAEGYRRCARSVIGPWSRLRDRRFRWQELRFEVAFVTPLIVLLTEEEHNRYYEHNEIYPLIGKYDSHSDSEPSHVSREIFETAHERDEQDENKVLSYKKSSDGTAARTTTELGLVEDTIGSQASSLGLKGKQRRRRGAAVRTSWVSLLKEMHRLYVSYWPSKCPTCEKLEIGKERMDLATSLGWAPDSGGLRTETALLSDRKHPNPAVSTSHAVQSIDPWAKPTVTATKVAAEIVPRDQERKDPAVIYKEFSWDFMPPDVTKPLAQCFLNDLIVIARRLGLSWSALSLEDKILNADGNGYALVAREVRDLGLVFQFDNSGSHSPFLPLVPSVASDKMLFGIIPGCPELVKKDFAMVKADGKILRLEEAGAMWAEIGIPNSVLDIVRRGGNDLVSDGARNETMMLLFRFIPVKGSNASRIHFPAWVGGKAPFSIFHYWEGRFHILQGLSGRISKEFLTLLPEELATKADTVLSRNEEHLADMQMSDIYIVLKHVETEFYHDFYDWWGQAVVAGSKSTNAEELTRQKAKLHHLTRRVFNFTTRLFNSEPYSLQLDGKHRGTTKFLGLVAAHLCMSRHAIKDSMAERTNNDQARLAEHYGVKERRGPHILNYMMDDASMYIRHHDRSETGIYHYYRECAGPGSIGNMSKEQCEMLWFALMVRGIVWDMAIDYSHEESAVIPSMYHEKKVPCWLT